MNGVDAYVNHLVETCKDVREVEDGIAVDSDRVKDEISEQLEDVASRKSVGEQAHLDSSELTDLPYLTTWDPAQT